MLLKKASFIGIQIVGLALVLASIAGDLGNAWGASGILMLVVPSLVITRSHRMRVFLMLIYGLCFCLAFLRLRLPIVFGATGVILVMAGGWQFIQSVFYSSGRNKTE